MSDYFDELTILLNEYAAMPDVDIYWPKKGLQETQAILNHFSGHDWHLLLTTFRHWPPNLNRLLLTALHAPHFYAASLPYVIESILSNNPSQAIEAVFTLARQVESMRIMKSHPCDYSAALVSRIKELTTVAPTGMVPVMQRLIDRLTRSAR